MNSLTTFAVGSFVRIAHKTVTPFVKINPERKYFRKLSCLLNRPFRSHSTLSDDSKIRCSEVERLKVKFLKFHQNSMPTTEHFSAFRHSVRTVSTRNVCEVCHKSEHLNEQLLDDSVDHSVNREKICLIRKKFKHKSHHRHVLNLGTKCQNVSTSCYTAVRGYRTSPQSGDSEEAKLFPITSLQRFIDVPIVTEDQMVFHPTRTQLAEGTRLFTSTKTHIIKHQKSVVDLEKLPNYDIPEVCFVGRSNVGKSSLIRTMFSAAPEVQERITVSRKPGHTKSLKFYQVGQQFTLVDMPGYGHNMPGHYVKSVEGYLKTRKNMVRSFVLIDGTAGITEADRIGLSMMEEFVIPYVIVFTKIDKVARHKLLRNLTTVLEYRNEHTEYCLPQPFLVSSMTGEGITLLQTFVAYITGNLNVS